VYFTDISWPLLNFLGYDLNSMYRDYLPKPKFHSLYDDLRTEIAFLPVAEIRVPTS
jgi:hypothetical protein